MKVVAVLQARASSRRLPGKVLMPLLGQPMLARQIERVRRARSIDLLVVATSDRAEDDAVAAVASAAGVATFRGSLDDVLDRLHGAAAAHAAEVVVRLTGDCPLADPAVIDRCVAHFVAGGYDYVSNTINPTWPDGLDVEVMRMAALERAWREADTPFEREHVTPFINRRPDLFALGSYEAEVDRSRLRWTVDERSDFTFVELVYAALYPSDPAFSSDRILQLLEERPELSGINDEFERNAGSMDKSTP